MKSNEHPGPAAAGDSNRMVLRFCLRHHHWIALAVSTLIGLACIREIFSVAGEAAAPLDDSFIHLQYARRLAEGQFLRYSGHEFTTGESSLVWSLLLAPFYKLGFRGTSLLYVTWAFGVFAHAGVGVATFRTVRRVAGESAALGAAAMCLVFGAHAWFAWSGMETMIFAWVVMASLQRSSAWCEPSRDSPPATRRAELELISLGFLAPLVRPEGVVVALMVGISLALRPRRAETATRAVAFIPIAGAVVVPLLNLVATGRAASSAATMKWLVTNPYVNRHELWTKATDAAWHLVSEVLNGHEEGALFLPSGATLFFLCAIVATVVVGRRERLPFHLGFVALLLSGMFIPCTYLGPMTHRVRYVWPFATVLFVCAGCFVREASDRIQKWRPAASRVVLIMSTVLTLLIAQQLPRSIEDLGRSAAAINQQQVKLARWAALHLPATARLGVNDAGALAYLSGRATFDMIGLTTPNEARYWVWGEGSRFEHYEKLPRERLPTHFVVYPEWVGHAMLLGRELTRATVTGQTNTGGDTMVLCEARYEALGTGAVPAGVPGRERLLDELDISDVESEVAHEYELGKSSYQDNRVDETVSYRFDPSMSLSEVSRVLESPQERAKLKRELTVDAGRRNRTVDKFTLSLESGRGATLILRVAAAYLNEINVTAGGTRLAPVKIEPGPWNEATVVIPASASGTKTPFVVESSLPFASYHYWLYSQSR